MARAHILFDKTEIVAMYRQGNKLAVVNLKFSDIQRIQFDHFEERALLRKVESEKISITTSKAAAPIVYTRLKEAAHWDRYKTGLAKFARDNTITFVSNL